MANYGINIDVKVKAQQLQKFNKEISATQLKVTAANRSIHNFAKTFSGIAVPSIKNFERTLARANKAFREAAIGTPQATQAARNFVRANMELNKGLEAEAKLLKEISIEMRHQETMRKLREKGIRPRTMFSAPIGPMPMMTVNNNPRIMRNIAVSQAARAGTGFGAFSESIRGGGIFPTKKLDAVTKSINRHAKNISKNIGTIVKLQTQQQTQNAFSALPGGSFGIPGGQIGPRLPLKNRLGFGKNAQGGPFSMPGGAMGRAKGGIGSALIGGGFPFLFGAGGLSAAMGGIAGGIGGALAPGGGFAASIAATAIASQVEKAIQFRKAIKKLNEEVSSMGIESEFSRKNIKKLAKEFDITNDEAVQLATTVKTFGEEQGLGLLSLFGSRENLDTLAGLRDTSSVLGKIQTFKNDISEKTRQELLQTLATKGSLQAQLDLEEALISKKRRKFIEDKKAEDLKEKNRIKGQRGLLFNKFKPLKDTETPEQQLQRLNDLFVFANASQFELLNNQIKINEQLQFLAEFQAPTDQLREMLNPMRQILDLSVSIRDGFEESFKGIIKGTMTVQEAFRSMLNRIADHFLDTAARMAATQIQKGFLGLFSGMFNFGTTNRANQFLGGVANPFGGGGSSGISFGSVDLGVGLRANGGPVKRGGSFIVGERGPELFSPGISGMITPNHALGGSTNVVVNVDASGSNVEGDEQGGRELGRLISAAVQSEIVQQQRPGGLLA